MRQEQPAELELLVISAASASGGGAACPVNAVFRATALVAVSAKPRPVR